MLCRVLVVLPWTLCCTLWMLCIDGELQPRILGYDRSLDRELRLPCEPWVFLNCGCSMVLDGL